MARKANVVPSYLLHRQSGQARCRIAGKDYLLGPYGSEESRLRFGDIVAKVMNGQPVDPFATTLSATPQAANALTVNELVLAYMRHAEKHYVKNGQATSEIHCLKSATRPLVELYGFHSVDSFGPLALKAVREKMISSGWCRKTVNKNVGRLRSIFRYGVENELVSPSTLQKLTAVAPLLAGRTEAPDNAPRTPATEEQIQAVKPFVSELVWDLVTVQRATGARAGELLTMTPEKIDRSGAVWLYDVDGHKTAHHGHKRVIALGPKAQAVLEPRMKAIQPEELVFPIRRDSYTLAIRRACEKHNRQNPKSVIEVWSPHQLRHARGHQVRRDFGLEHVQATLGHAEFSMSERYAQADLQRAIEAAMASG